MEVLTYYLNIKIGGVYKNVVKNFTRAQFESYYDAITDKGGKIIGIDTK